MKIVKKAKIFGKPSKNFANITASYFSPKKFLVKVTTPEKNHLLFYTDILLFSIPGERPYHCAYCPKNFQRRDLMRKHERIHTDTRPYACQFCHKAFTQR